MKQKSFFSLVMFVLQILLASFFLFKQTNAIKESVAGLSIVMFFSFWMSMVINLYLSYTSVDKQGKSDRDVIVLMTYGTWIVVMTIIMLLFVYYASIEDMDIQNELKIAGTVSFCSLIVLGFASIKGTTIRHPYIKGTLSSIFKSIPQLMLIPIILNKGVAGWNEQAIWVGHITVNLRIVLILSAIFKKKQASKEDMALLLSETANSISWILFTVVYYSLKSK